MSNSSLLRIFLVFFYEPISKYKLLLIVLGMRCAWGCRSVDVIVLGPVCKLRKIFTMRNRLAEMGGGCATMEFGGEECLPQEHMFALGVETAIQVLDMAALQTAITGLADSSADGM
jgi:hypothetical protein